MRGNNGLCLRAPAVNSPRAENTAAELIGATDDEGVKVGWIVEGFQLELLTDRGPVLTSTVESVDVE